MPGKDESVIYTCRAIHPPADIETDFMELTLHLHYTYSSIPKIPGEGRIASHVFLALKCTAVGLNTGICTALDIHIFFISLIVTHYFNFQDECVPLVCAIISIFCF